MFRTLKSNSPFSAPRDDTARASCGNGAKSDFLSFFSLPPFDPKLAPANAPSGWSVGIAESRDLLNWKKVGDSGPSKNVK